MSTNKNNLAVRVQNHCKKIKTLKQATRLWNWVDCQSNCDELWDVMVKEVPLAFSDLNNPCSIKFAY